MRIDSPKVPGVIYPDNNSSAEIFTNSDPHAYVELEFLSPLKTLNNRRLVSFTTTYTLSQYVLSLGQAKSLELCQIHPFCLGAFCPGALRVAL
ncbi:MAG: hypothetical protein F6J89_20160 [Symploca sp. SIO1C4]|uniref:Uncharacterized protein n=1 Tax=Symploca sp. SIO1C4 TaxID=2607765 RepID=A0A6B3N8C0_9CYAN|nr:hypothetical protein [Symploca sp. SIO1C4]NET07769.1 hypothetical protein [Symploca sp. SIO2B6]